jgi:hypothetical protein
MDPFASDQTPVAGDTAIIEQYPLPLARVWQRALIASPRPPFHHRQLLVAAEWMTCYLAAVAISAYEQHVAEGGAPDPALNRSLRSLRRVTFGQWLGWARSALAAVPKEAALVPGLRAAYEDTETGMMLMGYEGLRGLMVVQLGYTGEYGHREAVSPRLLLELINQYQLRLATHPPPPEAGFEEMAAVSVLGPGVRAVYSRMALLAPYPLLALVRTPQGVEALRLQGLGASASSVELEPGAEPPGSLLLATPEEMPALVLDPWLIYAECRQCGTAQVAAFAGQEAGARRYRGLDCEHRWTQDEALALAEVEIAGAGAGGAGWEPDMDSLAGDVPTDQQARLYAALEADAEALAAERRARPTTVAPAEPGAASHTDARSVYLDLLEQRAQGGLTLDQLQSLDEQRAADAERARAAQPPEPPQS